jgi:hypothetical protein
MDQGADVVERLEVEHDLFNGALPIHIDHIVCQAATLLENIAVGQQPIAGAGGWPTVFSRVLPFLSVTLGNDRLKWAAGRACPIEGPR